LNRIPTDIRRLVIDRALNLCEYCRLPQEGQEATFHIDHIVPFTSGGSSTPDNLALSCVSCSLRKGAREAVMDPDSGQTVELFHPRQQEWEQHFRFVGPRIEGLSVVGRATVAALAMNRPAAIDIRSENTLIDRLRHIRKQKL
jgi:hypothetical protein